MRKVTAAAVALLVVVGVNGCGLPGSTDVQVHGDKPSPEAPGGADSVAPVNRLSATTPKELVNLFLFAAAGDPEQAVERARAFIAPAEAAEWKPSSEINVVRYVNEPLANEQESDTSVDLRVQHLGVLTGNGSMDPPNTEETEYTITVGRVVGQSGYWVTSMPPLILLRDRALWERYQPTPVYFWNKDRNALVPDLRYLPLTISSERRPTELLEWLSGGPSGLISQAVDGLPANVKQKGNVPRPGADGSLEVNLSAEAGALDDDALKRLGTQIHWTLRDYLTGGDLLVKVEGQLRQTISSSDALLAANPSSELIDQPERFAIYDGRIVRMRGQNQAVAAPPLVTPETNTGVRFAAFSRLGQRTFGAWVRDRDAGGGGELVVGTEVPGAPQLRIPLGKGVAGRPAWLWMPDVIADQHPENMVGLVLVDGRLQQFGTQTTNRTPIAVTNLPGPIASMAVSHDGQRIALVSGGRLFVTALIRTDTSVKVSTVVREVLTSLRNITAADFASEDRLIVAGQQLKEDRVSVVEVTVDGVREGLRAADLGSAQVTYLAAYPVNPTSPNSAGSQAAYVANNLAYDLLSSFTRIETSQLMDAPADAVPNKIAAPFFLE